MGNTSIFPHEKIRAVAGLSYTDGDNDGSIDASTEIIEESNYYPFGLKHKGYNFTISPDGNNVAQKWKYNEKELNDELGLDWYDYGARNYDASLGRWMNLDPLAENYYYDSPYVYTTNNPVLYIDPDGRFWKRTVDENGNVTYTAEEGDSAYSLYEQFGEQDGFSADQANQVIEGLFGENRVEDGEEFSNIDPGDAIIALSDNTTDYIEKEGERNIQVVENDADIEETPLNTVNMGSTQFDMPTLEAQDKRKALVMMAQMTDPLGVVPVLKGTLKGLKMKGKRKTNFSSFSNNIRNNTKSTSESARSIAKSAPKATKPLTLNQRRVIKKRARKTLKKRKRQ